MTNQKGFTVVEIVMLIYVVVALAAIWGWIWNIVKIVHSDFAVMSGLLICRIVGIFVAPLGAVLGFL